MATISSAWMRPRTPTPTSKPASRLPIQAAESGQSTPTRALATTSRSQLRLPDHLTSAFTSWTRRRAFTTCAPTHIIQVADDAYPSVASIVNKAVSQAKQNTNGSEYEMALYLHDWLLYQLEYDNSLKWSSAESALTRGLGTCQAYESAYSKLLTAVGIINSETRDTYDGHTWNAVKLDGKWYQVDCTWDDTSDNFYGDLDQRHLYFCITYELMAIAHKGHAKIYTADGYATRSTSLKDNYFVHNGKADEWAAKYADRIQQHLDAKENKFSIDADNQSFPPSISGIQNGIVAFAMNLREWKTTDAKADLAANSIVAMQSGYKWISRFDFYATWKEPASYTIRYHGSDATPADARTTRIVVGTPTATLTSSALGFSGGPMAFAGRKAHRDCDDAWFVIDAAGNGRWAKLDGEALPEGWSFYRYVDGGKVSGTAPSGNVDFYATWIENKEHA